MTEWEILDTGVQSAEENMRLDAELLDKADERKRPVLHFYEWTGDSATYGHFIDPAKLLDLDSANKLQLHLARRPTGGGIIFHLWDMAFSVLVPSHCPEFSNNIFDNYALVNRAVLESVQKFMSINDGLTLSQEDFAPKDEDCASFCMAKPTKYDVMWRGKKVAGAAQRKTKKGFLHQGSIALMMPPLDYLEQVLLPGTAVKEAMQKYTYPLLRGSCDKEHMDLAKQRLRALLSTSLT